MFVSMFVGSPAEKRRDPGNEVDVRDYATLAQRANIRKMAIFSFLKSEKFRIYIFLMLLTLRGNAEEEKILGIVYSNLV